MNPHAIFLRAACVLPAGLNLVQKQFGTRWMTIGDTTSSALDEKVRNAGWHFMWLAEPCSCRGFSRTAASAVDKGIAGALKRIKKRFNAAELDSIMVSKYPGFQVAKVTLHPRHIQEQALLSLIDEITLQQLAAR